MSRYLPVVRFETEFDGDKVIAELEAMDRKTALEVSAMLTSAKDAAEKEQALALGDAGHLVLSRFLRSISGLMDANGAAIDVETVLSRAYFAPLRLELFGEVMSRSTLGKGLRTLFEEKSAASRGEPQ